METCSVKIGSTFQKKHYIIYGFMIVRDVFDCVTVKYITVGPPEVLQTSWVYELVASSAHAQWARGNGQKGLEDTAWKYYLGTSPLQNSKRSAWGLVIQNIRGYRHDSTYSYNYL